MSKQPDSTRARRPRVPRSVTGSVRSPRQPARPARRTEVVRLEPRQKRDSRASGVQTRRLPNRKRATPDVSLRAFALGLVLVLGILGVSQPLHQWWTMQREYKSLVYQIEQAQQKNEDLQTQIDRWADKSYVASQARARLGYVMRGETQYAVVDPGDDAVLPAQATPAHKDGPPRPWYLTVADTVDAAAEPIEKLNDEPLEDDPETSEEGE
ncbi:MAG: septum formation initiator family protein [Actinomycetaceae bacterium]|nr:septum formation initiator family protein [Actinomycetaceae bacterium]